MTCTKDEIEHLVARARAATAKAFLSGDGGTRYGAAVLVSDGRIFESGQYSSFNHQTGVHAEQAALITAVAAGFPNVVALAIASTNARDVTRPCGSCRQVILEHAARSGRRIDVVMTGPGDSYSVGSIDELLPLHWLPRAVSFARDAESRFRTRQPRPPQPIDRLKVGDQLLIDANTIALVWDPAFASGLALVKLKYVRQDHGWLKVPHAFTEGAEYEAFLDDHDLGQSIEPGINLPLVAVDRQWDGWPAIPLPTFGRIECCPSLAELPATLGIDPATIWLTGSLATGLNSPAGSDVDLVIRGDGPTVRRVRETIARCVDAGTILLEDESRSLRLTAALFGATPRRLLSDHRYAESLRIGGTSVSLMYDGPESVGPVVMSTGTPWSRACLHGVVSNATGAVFKRSMWTLQCADGPLDVICYHRLGSLVHEGDSVAVSGWIARSPAGGRVMLQFVPHRDTVVWFHSGSS